MTDAEWWLSNKHAKKKLMKALERNDTITNLKLGLTYGDHTMISDMLLQQKANGGALSWIKYVVSNRKFFTLTQFAFQ